MLTAIRNWVVQTMMKGQTGVVRTLPKREIIELNTQITAERMMRNGINPEDMKTVGQVENVVNQIDTPKVISADSAEGKGITEQLLGKKKADVLDMEGNKIPEGSKIMGGKEVKPIDKLKNYTKSEEEIIQDLVDQKFGKGYFDDVDGSKAAIKDAAIKARLDASNKKGIETIKINLVDDSIAKIKSMEPMDAMKEANLVAGKKGRYANLDDNQVKKIMDDTEDHIFERDIPDEDFATGGRVGLKGAGFINFIKNMTMNKKSPLQFGKDYLKNVKDKTLKANETGKFMDLPIAEVGIPAATGALVNNQIRKKLENMNEAQKEENLKMFIRELENDEFYDKYPDIKDEMIADYTERLFGVEKADGGRIGYKTGSVDKMRRLILKAMGAGTVGIGAAKSGIFSGLGKGAGKTVAKEVVQQTTSSTPPPYFFKLAEKIKLMGADATATTDRTIAKSLKSKDGKSEYLLEQDVSTGDTIIKKINKEGDEMITDVQIMEFRKGEDVVTKDGKAMKTPDEYEEVTEANARIEGDVYNDPYYSDGIEEIEMKKIIDEVDDKVPSIKYASGGLAYMLGE